MTRIFSSTKFWKVLMLAKPYKHFTLPVIYVALFALCWFATMLRDEYHWNIPISPFEIALVFLATAMFASIGMTSLMKYNGKRWKKVADTPFHTEGNRLVVAVPRKYMGWTANSVTFDFKWADNPVTLESPISFCLHGDTAPNRRFNYRCIWRR